MLCAIPDTWLVCWVEVLRSTMNSSARLIAAPGPVITSITHRVGQVSVLSRPTNPNAQTARIAVAMARWSRNRPAMTGAMSDIANATNCPMASTAPAWRADIPRSIRYSGSHATNE